MIFNSNDFLVELTLVNTVGSCRPKAELASNALTELRVKFLLDSATFVNATRPSLSHYLSQRAAQEAARNGLLLARSGAVCEECSALVRGGNNYDVGDDVVCPVCGAEYVQGGAAGRRKRKANDKKRVTALAVAAATAAAMMPPTALGGSAQSPFTAGILDATTVSRNDAAKAQPLPTVNSSLAVSSSVVGGLLPRSAKRNREAMHNVKPLTSVVPSRWPGVDASRSGGVQSPALPPSSAAPSKLLSLLSPAPLTQMVIERPSVAATAFQRPKLTAAPDPAQRATGTTSGKRFSFSSGKRT